MQLKNLKIFSSNTQGVFYISVVFMIITTIITLVTTKEEIYIPQTFEDENEEKKKTNLMYQCWLGIRFYFYFYFYFILF